MDDLFLSTSRSLEAIKRIANLIGISVISDENGVRFYVKNKDGKYVPIEEVVDHRE